jgi:hypothetical protein
VATGALPNTYGAPAADSRSSDPDAFAAYYLSLDADDHTTYTQPVHGFSFPYPKEYVLSTVVTDEGEAILAASPRFRAGIEIT